MYKPTITKTATIIPTQVLGFFKFEINAPLSAANPVGGATVAPVGTVGAGGVTVVDIAPTFYPYKAESLSTY